MCEDIHLKENKHSFLIKELDQSYVRLPKNQSCNGWVIVFLKRHANELFELEDQQQSTFIKEIAHVAKAVKKVFAPIKINYAIYGNLCPHVHCHILPRQFDDDPHTPIKMDETERFLSDDEYQKMITQLRKALAQSS
ncbi:hypothetical protein A2239_04120 [Candidatus Uhrbacteria bacterium RIFOXYA2_FULL_40_9]|nr:MAG: hypothetical protein A2239_04120 [Candidatus Uhrbacteria bacterium RIFOXYA2_FULL_40_9]OGL97829.1 MAG: hypothetical protein A2332_02505 [Candidatus Uhrbacteria bacterium RIFOXYB2_FULL_41_18]